MEASENPYASPTEAPGRGLSAEEVRQLDQDLAIARRETRFPAMGLLACTLLSCAVVTWTTGTFTLLGGASAQPPWLAKHIVGYWYLYLLPFGAYAFCSFFGALSLWKCQNGLLAKCGCVVNLFPLHPFFPLALAFAWKGLIALSKPEVQEVFRRAALDLRSNRTRAIARLFGPASILLLMSGATMLIVVWPFIVDTVDLYFYKLGFAEQHWKNFWTIRGVFHVMAILGAIIVPIAAIQMLRGRQYWVCIAGAIMAIIPFLSPCIFFGLPFGVWALVILLQRDTRAAFAEVD